MVQHQATTLEERVNNTIENISLNEEPSTLFDPMRYILSLGGKRLRPLLTFMAASLFDKNEEAAKNVAIAIELFHNFSLLHDDVMDRSDMRRGHPTVHKKWDDNRAILSGDAMLIEAYKYIADVPKNKLPEVLHLFTKTAMEVCKGQQYDMDFEKRFDVTEDEYLEMIRLKTGVLIACALKLGAIVADAPASDASLLYDFGINIGLAFQLKDDLLDVYGDPKTFGKNTGGDIVCNKKTYLLIKALKLSDKKQSAELHKWLSAKEFDRDEKIDAVKNIYNDLNLKIISENLIEKYYLAALDCLSAINVANEKKQELIILSENLMYREK